MESSWSKGNESRPKSTRLVLVGWLTAHSLPLTASLCCLVMVVLMLHLSGLPDKITQSLALREAGDYSQALIAVRRLYSSEVVARVRDHGIEVSHDYVDRDGVIPLPATFSFRLAKEIGVKGNAGTTMRLYSDYPFPWRKDAVVLDDFQRAALRRLRADPNTAFLRCEEYAGKRSLRYAIADLMEPSCVSCHNSHPDSPKTDWRAGDVRGVLEVIVPLDGVAVQVNAEFSQTIVLILLVTSLAIGLTISVIVRQLKLRRAIEAIVSERTAELRTSRDESDHHRDLYETILQTAACGIITIDDHGVVLSFNDAAGRMFQYDACDVVGENVKILMPTPYRQQHGSFLASYRDSHERTVIGSSRETVGRRKDDSSFPLRLAVSEIGDRGCFTAVVEDLSESNARIAAIEAAADMIVITDVNGRFKYVNRAFSTCTGYSPKEVLGMRTSLLKSGRHGKAFYKQMWGTIRAGDVWSGKVVNRRKDGSLYDEEMAIAPVKDATGAVSQFVAIKRDITCRNQAELALAQARDEAQAAVRTKSEFLANMSHEIRTPLNAVIGMTGLLLDTDLSPDQRECVEILRSGGESLLAVVSDILDFSKIEAGMIVIEDLDVEPVKLVERVADLFTKAATDKGIELLCSIDPAIPAVLSGDPLRLHQVLTNLVGNAVKFTGEGGINIRVVPVEKTAERTLVRFEVIDTGIGVPADVQALLFQPFSQADGSTTRRFGGTGLGLVISRQLTELLGGEIGIESDGEHGSKFWFTIPFGRT